MAKKPQQAGPSIEEQIATAYERGKADGIAMTEAQFAPDPLYRHDLCEVVKHLESLSVCSEGAGTVVGHIVGPKGVGQFMFPNPVFNLVWMELRRLGYGS